MQRVARRSTRTRERSPASCSHDLMPQIVRRAERTVGEVWEEERTKLLPLPVHFPSTDLVTPVSVDKTASERLATNRYAGRT